MSRVFAVALVAIAAFSTEAIALDVNLDKPGALEALKRDRVVDVTCCVTAHLTEHPGQVEKAK
jgi:hypothetical protein